MINGYIRGKTRKAEDKQIKTLIYNAIINTEKIGNKTISEQLLIQHVCEHMDMLRLNYTLPSVQRCLDEMIEEDKVYRVSTVKGMCIGRATL